MILVLPPDVSPGLLDEIQGDVTRLGFQTEVSRGAEQVLISLTGKGDEAALPSVLAGRTGVDAIPIVSGSQYWQQRSRRRFMTGLASGLGLLTAAGLTAPVIGFLVPPEEPLSTPSTVRAAAVSQVPDDTARMVRFHGMPLLLVNRGKDRYFAVSAICTHMNTCQLEWSPERHQLLCPCHGGAFDVHGNILDGPATKPLQTYEVERLGDDLYVRREGRNGA